MTGAPLPYPIIWADSETAARLFSIPESTFREHVNDGRLPQGVKIGKKRLWRVPDVDEALAKLPPPSLGRAGVMGKTLDGRGVLCYISHANSAGSRQRALRIAVRQTCP